MSKFILIFAGCLAVLAGSAFCQEVIITDFPVGAGSSITPEFFRPYNLRLQVIADTLRAYPTARAIVTGGADGIEYRRNHDAQNPGLALGRAHALRNLLVYEFGVDSTRIMIESQEAKIQGPALRFASVRIAKEPTASGDLGGRVEALENRPPVERHFTEVREVPNEFIENCGLQVSAGFSSSPFGAIPVVAGAVTWKRFVYIEGIFGHTIWDDTYRLLGVELDTRRRMAGVFLACYPVADFPVGVVGGWVRIEEVSQRYYDYVRLSEGPMFGLRVTPFDFVSATAVYNPSRHRTAVDVLSHAKNSQFLVSIMAHKTFGGGK